MGQVKYTLVHPHNSPIPNDTMLDTGTVVAGKMKTLAAGTETAFSAKTSDIKAIRTADSLPSGFVATDANTVSTSTSRHPIYIFFDNTNDAGIMYFYAGDYQVVMNPDSSRLFRSNLSLSDISGISDWDSSNVTDMQYLLLDGPSLTTLDALANWDTSNVENMTGILYTNPSTLNAGYTPQLSNISALANWNTSKVNTLYLLFGNALSLSNISALSFWDISKVTNLNSAFAGAPIINIDALSDWNVSNVEDMTLLLGIGREAYSFGARSHLTDISGLVDWNTESVTDMTAVFQHADKITNLDALSSWGTFNKMFLNSTATLEAFTFRLGTWDSNGTYIPSS